MISTVWHYNSQTVKSRGIHWLVSTSARISLASNNNRNAAIFMQLKNPVAINVWLRFAIRHTNSNFCYIEWAICNKLTKKRERWSELFMQTTDCTSRFELCKSCISFGIIKDEQKQAEHIVSRLTPVSYIPPASYPSTELTELLRIDWFQLMATLSSYTCVILAPAIDFASQPAHFMNGAEKVSNFWSERSKIGQISLS